MRFLKVLKKFYLVSRSGPNVSRLGLRGVVSLCRSRELSVRTSRPFELSHRLLLSTDERTSHPALPETYKLRVKSNSSTLCDNTVKQHSGYLDINENKHLFFWYCLGLVRDIWHGVILLFC